MNKMKLTKETYEKVNRKFEQLKKAEGIYSRYHCGLGNELVDEDNKAVIQSASVHMCEMEDLGQMIEELILLKHAITEVTGIMWE